ncbi:MAG: hypothetical protein ACUVV4_07905 [Candidatus Bathyarchaeia archaeon]
MYLPSDSASPTMIFVVTSEVSVFTGAVSAKKNLCPGLAGTCLDPTPSSIF